MADSDIFVLLLLAFLAGLALANRPSSVKTYSNIEEWEIVKDEDTGRVRGVRVHRRAEEA